MLKKFRVNEFNGYMFLIIMFWVPPSIRCKPNSDLNEASFHLLQIKFSLANISGWVSYQSREHDGVSTSRWVYLA